MTCVQTSGRGHSRQAPEGRPTVSQNRVTGPRACCIHRCCGTRSGPAARVPERLSSRTVASQTSSATSRLLLPRFRVFLGQVPLGGEVVVPTAIPVGTRGIAAVLRFRVRYGLRVPPCNGRVPVLHGRSVPLPERSCPPHSAALGGRAAGDRWRGEGTRWGMPITKQTGRGGGRAMLLLRTGSG